MMPFSVVRTLVTGMVSWALLGVGIYFAYEAYQGLVPVDDELAVVSVPKTIDHQAANELDETELQVVVIQKEYKGWKPWAELAAALFCLGLTVGGRLPMRLFFGNMQTTAGSEPQMPKATSVFVVERPDGSQLHGEVFENVGKPTLLLTHGWSLDSSAWKYLISGLNSHYRIVIWDHAGLGKSRGPSNHDHSLEKLANDLNAVLEQLAPNGPVILIGHSIGGMTQQTFCRLYGEKLGESVKGLVLVHTTYTNPVSTNVAAWITKPLEPLLKLINFTMIPLSPFIWLSNWQSYYNGSLHVSARLESFTGKQTWEQLDHSAWMGAKARPSVVARGNFGMMKFDEERTLPKINIPVLVISGEHDRLTVQSASKRIETLLPRATAFCDHGGHLGQWEHTDSVNESILKFASKVIDRTSAIVPISVSPQKSERNSFGVH